MKSDKQNDIEERFSKIDVENAIRKAIYLVLEKDEKLIYLVEKAIEKTMRELGEE